LKNYIKILFINSILIIGCTSKKEKVEVKLNPEWMYLGVKQDVIIKKSNPEINIIFDNNFKSKKINDSLYNIFCGTHKGKIKYEFEGDTFKIDTIKVKPPPIGRTPELKYYDFEKSDSVEYFIELESKLFDSLFHNQNGWKVYEWELEIFEGGNFTKYKSDTTSGYIAFSNKIDADSIRYSFKNQELRSGVFLRQKNKEFSYILFLKEKYFNTIVY